MPKSTVKVTHVPLADLSQLAFKVKYEPQPPPPGAGPLTGLFNYLGSHSAVVASLGRGNAGPDLHGQVTATVLGDLAQQGIGQGSVKAIVKPLDPTADGHDAPSGDRRLLVAELDGSTTLRLRGRLDKVAISHARILGGYRPEGNTVEPLEWVVKLRLDKGSHVASAEAMLNSPETRSAINASFNRLANEKDPQPLEAVNKAIADALKVRAGAISADYTLKIKRPKLLPDALVVIGEQGRIGGEPAPAVPHVHRERPLKLEQAGHYAQFLLTDVSSAGSRATSPTMSR